MFTIQDEASQLISYVAAPEPHTSVLDLCAGTGIKATHFAQMTKGTAVITAVDNAPRQLARLRANISRMKCKGIEAFECDLRTLKDVSAHTVLLDAPCSGLGTVRRRPDIKWNRTENDSTSRLPALQAELLCSAAAFVEEGGVLVYSTCTTEPEENEEVVRRFLGQAAEFSLEPPRLPGNAAALVTNDGFFTTFPHRHGTDGFFAARLRKAAH